MHKKCVNLLQVITILCGSALSAKTCRAQGIVQPNALQIQPFTGTVLSAHSSSIRIKCGVNGEWAIQIQKNANWWDLNTAEGKLSLRQLLSEKANRRVEVYAVRKRYTPDQIAKLQLAAGIQVARDCRAIQELASSFVEAVAENPNGGAKELLFGENGLIGKSAKIGRLVEAGIVRKDSLFVKVMRNWDK